MITFSGKDFINLKNDKAYTFTMRDTSFSNITGSGCFGFSGALNKSFNFKFIKGALYDSNNNLFSNYSQNQGFDFSGIVDEANYSYHIDGNEYSLGSTRSNYKIQNFFVETTGVNMSTELDVYAKEPRKLTFSLPQRFDVSGLATGTIANASTVYPLDIFTGQVLNDNNFTISSISKTGHLTVNNSINFVLQNNTGEVGVPYDLNLLFNTSAGDVTRFKRSKAEHMKLFERSSLNQITTFDVSGSEALSSDSGRFFFDNRKETFTGSGVVGDDYSVFLKYKAGYTGVTTGWAGAFSISAGGSGYTSSPFTLLGGGGAGATGNLLVNNGVVTGLRTLSVGENYSGASKTFRADPVLGFTGNVISSGTGLNITPTDYVYNKKFQSVWSMKTGLTMSGLVSVTGEVQSMPALSGLTSTNTGFFIVPQANAYYDSMIQTADIIVSGVTTNKTFTLTITGVK